MNLITHCAILLIGLKHAIGQDRFVALVPFVEYFIKQNADVNVESKCRDMSSCTVELVNELTVNNF